jgi:hypothetical protein
MFLFYPALSTEQRRKNPKRPPEAFLVRKARVRRGCASCGFPPPASRVSSAFWRSTGGNPLASFSCSAGFPRLETCCSKLELPARKTVVNYNGFPRRDVSSPKLAPSWSGVGMTTLFEAVLAALLERDNVYSSDLEQKNIVKAEFLRGAATAFALCWRGEEGSQCLEAAKGLDDQLKSPDRGAMPLRPLALTCMNDETDGRGCEPPRPPSPMLSSPRQRQRHSAV